MTLEEKAEEYIASKTKEWTDGAYDFTLEEVRTMLIEFAKELEQENNRLKAENEELKTRVENQKSFLERIRAKFELGEIERKEIEGYLEGEQLTKAKELLEKIIEFEPDSVYFCEDYKDEMKAKWNETIKQAEQFLKEIIE